MKKILALVLVAVMMLATFASCGESAATNYAANNTEYFIGGTGPLTGDASSYGISVQNGAKLAVEKINANGGLNGVNFKFDIKDDQATADKASSAYDQLFEAGMQISFGSVTSGSCEAFAAKAANDNLFFMTPSASAEICIAESNAFRVCFGDPDQGVLAAEELVANFQNIGAIYDESDTYSSGIFEAFDAKMKELNATYTVKTFNAENKLDFSTQVEALKDCDVIFLPIYYTEAGLIAKVAVAKGCDAVLFGCDGFDGIAGQIDETVTNQIKYITPFDVNSTDANVAEFVAAYETAYGVKPDQFAADGYDVVMAIYEAMKAAGVNDVTIDPDTLCEKVKAAITADSFVFTGVTGTMTWDLSGAATKEPVIIELNK
ncbi:MAG: ABC transporter substrate-binding protein [Clostridia bacterium]|nr:ABC transporter substrate-binding protein [Clostridia bacterium]